MTFVYAMDKFDSSLQGFFTIFSFAIFTGLPIVVRTLTNF
jgi:hypothetical protein